MELFRIKRDLPLMKHALIFNVISFLTFAAAVFFLVTRGLHFSIEFTGGTVIEVAYPQAAEIERTRHTIEQMGFGEVQVQNFGSSRDVMIRLPIRGDVKQTELVDKVFTALCAAEQGQVSPHQVVTPQGESITKAGLPHGGGCRAHHAVALRGRRPGCGGRAGGRRGQGPGRDGRRHHDLPGLPLRVEVRRRGHHRQPATW